MTSISDILGARCIFKELGQWKYESCRDCNGRGYHETGRCEHYIPTKKAILPKQQVQRNWNGFINQIRKYNDGGVI